MPSPFPKPTFGRRPAAAQPNASVATIVAQRTTSAAAKYPTRVVRIVKEGGRWVEKVGRPMCLWPRVNFRPILGPITTSPDRSRTSRVCKSLI